MSDEEKNESPYCEVCGTCGCIGCCGIRNFISEHIEGKTNCKNEGWIIQELINLCDYKDEVFEENKRLKKIEEEHKNCTRKHWQSKCFEHCANEKILQRQIEIMERYFELICDIGYDYDGCNSVESLKALVDELTHLASLGRACNDKEAMYSDGNNRKLNILLEEIKDERNEISKPLF